MCKVISTFYFNICCVRIYYNITIKVTDMYGVRTTLTDSDSKRFHFTILYGFVIYNFVKYLCNVRKSNHCDIICTYNMTNRQHDQGNIWVMSYA